MRFSIRASVWVIPTACVLSLTLTSSLAWATEPDDRAGFSGRQLFDHQWKWIGPASAPEARNRDARDQAARDQAARRLEAKAFLEFRRRQEGDGRGDGLGPLHNATSCVECHLAGGGSGVQRNVTVITIDPRSELSPDPEVRDAQLRELFPGVAGLQGVIFNTVVHDRSTRDGYATIRSRLADFVPGGIDERWFVPEKREVAAIAKRPVIAGRCGPIDYYLSQRNPPALFGLGAIQSVSTKRLRNLAKRQAIDSGGQITGRVAGRFGWRGQIHTLHQFVVGACASELGLSQASVRQADDPADPTYVNLGTDMTSREVTALSKYIAEIPRPVERSDKHHWKQVLRGEELFDAVGCSQCHVADIHPISGLFSDLLLHDMGPDLQAPSPAPIGELQDVRMISKTRSPTISHGRMGSGYFSSPTNPPIPYPLARPEHPRFPRGKAPEWVHLGNEGANATWDALQREWRTPPLWGVADTAPYLHDGRAETLDEAIRWHGGEAEPSRDKYVELSDSDRDLVIAFLSSLRAPKTKSGDEKE